MTAFIRNLSPPAEFCIVLVACFWFALIGSIEAIAMHSWTVHARVSMTNVSALTTVVVESLALAFAYWIGPVRGWSFAAWGFRPSWKLTGAGVLLCGATALAAAAASALTNVVSPGAIHPHVVRHVSPGIVALVVAVNPIFEETLEAGYFIQSLQRYGIWIAVAASAVFRAFLHAYQGLNALVVIFPLGLIFGFAYWKWRRLWPLFVAHAPLDLYALLPAIHPD